MKKIKVMTVVGTRPEIIRLSAVINKLDKSDAFVHILVHTGQNYDYELNEVFFKDLNIRKPDYFLEAAEGNPMATIGNIIGKIDPILQKEQPDAFLVLGDTNSCLSAIAAKRRHIPIFHMEAGNRCFDQRVPEETNRKIVDHIADINLPYSDISRQYLIQEGFPSDRIIKTGSPMLEVINSKQDAIDKSDILKRLNLRENGYFVLSAHREENIDDDYNFKNLVESINAVADKYKLPIIFSTHPRTLNRIKTLNITFNRLVRIEKPLGYIDYIKLQIHAKAVLSDSGTISEEASILGLKALNIRYAHERPEAMEEASVMMIGLEKEKILNGLVILEEQKGIKFKNVYDYSKTNVSDKIIRIIISYIEYVEKKVYGKHKHT
jgi:UDP-N-acetyl-L-fucosamine synthase